MSDLNSLLATSKRSGLTRRLWLLPCLAGIPVIAAAGVPSPSVGAAIVMNTLWEIPFGPDYGTTATAGERDLHPPYLGLSYVASGPNDVGGNPLPGVQILYRLLSGSGADHMDSEVAGEGGYTTEGPLGYVWSNGTAGSGLSPLIRVYDTVAGTANYGDHRTSVQTAPVPINYHVEGPIGYGYARYPGTDNVPAWQSGGPLAVMANLAVGCSLWGWWWNGIQFINDYDYGRQMQVTLSPADSGVSFLAEAGDQFGSPTTAVDARHPSPCVSYSAGSSAVGNFQTTAAVPLDWAPQNFGGGADNPVIYPAIRLGKTITLDWIGPDGLDRNWPVAVFQTTINSPHLISPAAVEAPSGYLVSTFNTYYYYSPATQVLTQVPTATVQAVSNTGYAVPLSASAPQAVILASGTSPMSTAMGVYINNPNSGFVFYDNSSGASPGQYGSNFVKWEVRYFSDVAAGGWTYNTWVMTDTVQNVEAYMNQLYAWGVSSR